ncbi:AzlD domain-containing protein [Pseudomonas sp. MOB-449]|nr:AzlD domain-containing protein [Pseudomonas sp. MOB-449]
MIDWSLWGVFVAVGVGTFALRLSFIELYGRLSMPPVVQRALAYVPASVLAALVLPAVTLPHHATEISLENPRLYAATVAALVALVSRNTILTMTTGMGALWALQYLGW